LGTLENAFFRTTFGKPAETSAPLASGWISQFYNLPQVAIIHKTS
jgi:hypothetical protein